MGKEMLFFKGKGLILTERHFYVFLLCLWHHDEDVLLNDHHINSL